VAVVSQAFLSSGLYRHEAFDRLRPPLDAAAAAAVTAVAASCPFSSNHLVLVSFALWLQVTDWSSALGS